MGQLPQNSHRAAFDESIIPREVMAFFSSLDRNELFWTRAEIGRLSAVNETLPVQLLAGLFGQLDRIIARAADEAVAEKFRKVKANAERSYADAMATDPIGTAISLQAFLMSWDIKPGNLSPREVLTRAYLDNAQVLAMGGLDPRRRLAYQYREFLERRHVRDHAQEAEMIHLGDKALRDLIAAAAIGCSKETEYLIKEFTLVEGQIPPAGRSKREVLAR